MYTFETRIEYFNKALLASVLAHLFFFYYVFFHMTADFEDLPPMVVYSISIEGSENKGGIAQVAKDDKVDKAPPKLIQNQPEIKKEEKKEEEVLVDKALSTPSPKPTTKPTPKPKASPKPADNPKDNSKKYQEAMQRYLGESTNAGGQGFGSAGKTAGKGMGGGVVKPPEWFKYKESLEFHIKQGWNWHESRTELIATVSYEMKPDGQLFNIKLVKSSGNSLFDESVVRAVNKANPVPAPKPEFYNDFKAVLMDFKPESF